MSSGTFGQPARASRRAVLALAILTIGIAGREARADRPPPTAAISAPGEPERAQLPQRGESSRTGAGSSRGSSAWWLGTVGVAGALAVFGAVSMASRKFLPQQGSSSLRVVGRTNLSPKHTVYLLQAGDRVLIVGTGPQGAPSLLGEMTDADDGEPAIAANARLAPAVRSERTGGDSK